MNKGAMKLMTCKRRILFTLLAVFLTQAPAFSEQIHHVFKVEVTAPSSDFYVISEGGWVGEVQRLIWRADLSRLETLKRWIVMQSTGPISVSAGSEMALVSEDGDKIMLTVKLLTLGRNCDISHFNNIASPSCTLLPGASNRQRVALEVWPAAGGVSGYQPGLYYGVVNLLFESTL